MALPYATENQLKLLEQKTKYELDKKISTELEGGLATKQDKLKAGENITISEDNTISASSGGFKYKIYNFNASIFGEQGTHTYEIGEQVGYLSETIPLPDDYHDGVAVMLGTTTTRTDVAPETISRLSIESGDTIWYIFNAIISKKSDGSYDVFGRAQTINAGTATIGSVSSSAVGVRVALIYN